MLSLTTAFNVILEVLANAICSENKIQHILIKRKILTFFADHIIDYIVNLKELTKNSGTNNWLQQGCEIQGPQKSVLVYITTVTKQRLKVKYHFHQHLKMKYLGMNLANYVHNLYEGNCEL